MIDLKAFKENATKYLHRIMIEVQPQDVVEICERAIAAEELAEARLLVLARTTQSLSNADEQIRELKAQLVQIKNSESVQLSAVKPVGYLVRGTFFYSRDQAQNSCDHITENFENCSVEPVYLSAGQPKLAVWYGSMPESNGKSNWTALLHRADSKGFDTHTDGITISRSEYPERVLYEADYLRWLIGELPTKPDILAYDADKHSGYVEPVTEIVGHKPQRITEQDMKTVLCEYFYSLNGLCQVGLTGNRAKHIDDWIDSNIGHKTLTKLNEHREPEPYKVQRDLLLAVTKALLTYCEDLQDEGPTGSGWKSENLEKCICEAEVLIARCEGK